MGGQHYNINSPLCEYISVDWRTFECGKKDPRLTYQKLLSVKMLSEKKPYLDCEVKCGCGKYYHHLSFKIKSGYRYSCPQDLCKGVNLKDKIDIR